jgi:hypothetical protein
MRFSDDILMRFADGELPEDEAALVREAMADDRELSARVERFKYVRRALRQTYDSVAQEPIPERFRALLGDMALNEPQAPSPHEEPQPLKAPVVSLAEARRARTEQRFTPPVWGAMAASVLIGLFAGSMLMRPAAPLLQVEDGQLRAGAGLAEVLDTRLSSDAVNARSPLHVGVSFRAQDGGYCRTFDSVLTNKAVSGLACRQSGAWIVRIATTEPVVASDYRQAGSAAPAVMNMVDTLMAGEPLTDAQERQARDEAWQAR